MRHKTATLCALLLLGLGLTGLQAQTAVPATGGNASGSGGTVSYTFGQVVYTTNASASGTVAQGVQQPYEISIITAIEQAKGINLSISVYPNPTSDHLTLSVEDYDVSKLSYQLYDISGQVLQTKKLDTDKTSIDMSPFARAPYFLKVVEGSKEIKSFKIIKN